MKRHPLDEATRLICGDDSGLRDPQRWVVRQLRAGHFSGLKIGRNWFMTDADIQAAIRTCRRGSIPPTAPDAGKPSVEPRPAAAADTIIAGLSARAARRLRSAS